MGICLVSSMYAVESRSRRLGTVSEERSGHRRLSGPSREIDSYLHTQAAALHELTLWRRKACEERSAKVPVPVV